MEFLKLEILNLASLDKQGGEVINFEEGALGETSIFSIVGSTGSGKSTLLDAICLALYNRAPRYPRKKGDRNQNIEIYGTLDDAEINRLAPTDGRNILTRGKKEGYSKLTFHANNGNIYRAEWSVRFNRTQYANPETLLYKIENKDGKLVQTPCKWEDLPQIIGLEYEQFLRTVLIAQGSFASFLTAKEEERYKLLEKLIGCEELYESIARKIKEKREEAQSRYNEIKAQVVAFEQYRKTDEELNALNAQIETLEQEEKALGEQIKAIEKALEWYDIEVKRLDEIEKQKEEERKANEALDTIKKDIEKLKLHDAILPAIDILREVKRLEEDIESAEKKIAEITANIEKQKEVIAENNKQKEVLEEKAHVAQASLDQALPHIQEARKLQALITPATDTFNEKQLALTAANADKAKADKDVEDNSKNIEQASLNKKTADETVEKLKAEIDVNKKQLIEAETIAANNLEAEKKKIEGQSVENLQQAKDKAEENWRDLNSAIEIVGRINEWNDALRKHTERKDALVTENEIFSAKLKTLSIDSLKQEVDTLKNSYTLMASEDWAMHRSNLHDGEPCPLCGGTHHPYAIDTASFDATTSKLNNLLTEKEKTLADQQKTEKELSRKIEQNVGELKSLENTIIIDQDNLQKEEDKWSEIVEKHPDWKKDESVLEGMKASFETAKTDSQNALSAYNKVQQEISKLTTIKETATKAKTDYEQQSATDLKAAEEAVNKAITALEGYKAQTANLIQQQQDKNAALQKATEDYAAADNNLKQLKQKFYDELGRKNPDEVEKQLTEAKEVAAKAVADKVREISAFETKLGELQGSLTPQNDMKTKNQESKQKKGEELNEWLNNYNNNSVSPIDVEVVGNMLAANDDWESIRENKRIKENALISAKTLREKAEKDMAEHRQSKPEKTADELKLEKDTLKQNSKKQELDDLTMKRTKHYDAIKNMGEKADELAQATLNNDDWKAVADSIGGDGKTLRKIAQCYTLRFLVEHANDEIRKFNSRYELQQVKNSLGLRIIDHDRADDVRDTTSLSGGETFIVSLGLALGLSSLSSRNISFGNLFIDEGFGTLDPDTLATVIDSLAMLQTSQGKKVGVISHTDTMSERITTQIRIIKNGNSGSSHIEIYP